MCLHHLRSRPSFPLLALLAVWKFARMWLSTSVLKSLHSLHWAFEYSPLKSFQYVYHKIIFSTTCISNILRFTRLRWLSNIIVYLQFKWLILQLCTNTSILILKQFNLSFIGLYGVIISCRDGCFRYGFCLFCCYCLLYCCYLIPNYYFPSLFWESWPLVFLVVLLFNLWTWFAATPSENSCPVEGQSPWQQAHPPC